MERLLDSAERAFAEGTVSGYRMSLIEADKVLGALLAKRRFPGQNTEERLALACGRLSFYRRLLGARAKTQEIIAELEYGLTKEQVREFLAVYKEAVGYCASLPPRSFLQRLGLSARLLGERHELSHILFVALSAVAAVLFLSKTALGLSLVAAVVGVVDFLVFRLFIFLLIAALALLVLLALFFYFDRRRGRRG